MAEPLHHAPGRHNPAPSFSPPHNSHGLIRYVRTGPPGSFTITLDQYEIFKTCFPSGDEHYYASNPFEVGGYDWRLYLYPHGDEKAEGYISLHLAVARGGIGLPKGWEANVSLKMFVYNQIEDNYLTVEDDHHGLIRFHERKTIHGYSHLISHETFYEPSNGYLVNRCCTFGVEILVIDRTAIKSERCKKNTDQFPKLEFQIDCPSFSNQTEYSKHCFVTAGGRDWKISLFPKGLDGSGEFISFEVKLADDDDVTMPSLEAKLVDDAASSCSKENSSDSATTAFKKLLPWFQSFNVVYQKLWQWLPALNVRSKPIERERATYLRITLRTETESQTPHPQVIQQYFVMINDTTTSEDGILLCRDFLSLDKSEQFLVDDNLRIYVIIETLYIKQHR